MAGPREAVVASAVDQFVHPLVVIAARAGRPASTVPTGRLTAAYDAGRPDRGGSAAEVGERVHHEVLAVTVLGHADREIGPAGVEDVVPVAR